MRCNNIRAVWDSGRCVVNGWLAIPSSFSAEVMAHCGWDSLCIDIQHGMVDYQIATTMMQAISTTPVTPIVRVPWNDPAIIMKCLDAGAYGVVCPMINTAEEASRFVAACRYPPMGYRSFGPIRAQIYGGSDYAAKANDEIVTLAMIETTAGLENLESILKVEGLDGVYIGPADLSLSFGIPGRLDPSDAKVVAAIETILAKCKAAQRRCGIHTGSIDYARNMIKKGFDFVTILGDSRILAAAAETIVRGVKADSKSTIASSTY
jgi:4-hydroxy-2-oxoheptanedioate aldolase